MKRLALAVTVVSSALAGVACNGVPLLGLGGGGPAPTDTIPPGWNPGFGPDKFVYFWRIGDDGTGNRTGVIWRQDINSGALAEFYRPTDGLCVGCHSLSHDGKYMANAELVTRFTLQPTLHIVKVVGTNGLPTEIHPFATPPEGSYSSWEPTAAGVPADRVVFASTQGLKVASVSSGTLFTISHTIDGGMIASMPSWGPNGQILYAAGPYGDGPFVLYQQASLYQVRPDPAATPELVYSDPANMSYFPEWSPAGRWVAFTSTPAGQNADTFASTGARVKILDTQTGAVFDPHELDAVTDLGRSWATFSALGNRITCGSVTSCDQSQPTSPTNCVSDIFEADFDPLTGSDFDAGPAILSSGVSFNHIPRWSP